MTIALITGAGRGLGFEIARQLGKRGVHVILGARDAGQGRTAVDELERKDITADTVVMDVTDTDSIRSARHWIAANHDHLDILVNNAGILNDAGVKAGELAFTDLRATFETNFFGVFATTQIFLPLLRQAPAGRIVNITSDLGSLAAMGDPAHRQYGVFAAGYQASKCALNALTLQFAKELADTPIKVNSASPGVCRTDMGGADAPLSVAEGAATAVWLATLEADGPTGGFFSSTLDGGAHPW
jgi:NAD(P)-dependent dehydrogenase (short-subunit alcohol dehydrogenase family)